MMSQTDLSCPWSTLQASGFPICEEAVCSLVRQPGNTVSNVGFFAVGLYLIYRSRRTGNSYDFGIGICAFLIGTFSTLAHAIGGMVLGFLDFASIFSLGALFMSRNLRINKQDSVSTQFLIFGAVFASVLTLLFILRDHKPLLMIMMVNALLLWEMRILKTRRLQEFIASTYRILLSFIFGGIAIGLDSSGLVCDPQNHFFQLHMVWHLIMALNIYFIANHMVATRLAPVIELSASKSKKQATSRPLQNLGSI